MFSIIYLKTTGKIISYRHDLSTAERQTAKVAFDLFMMINEIDETLYDFAELPYTKNLSNLIIGKHLYNQATGEIEEDPAYVEPVELTPTEPTA